MRDVTLQKVVNILRGKHLDLLYMIYFLRRLEFCVDDIVEELFDDEERNWERLCFNIGRLSQLVSSELDDLEEIYNEEKENEQNKKDDSDPDFYDPNGLYP